MQDCLEQVEPWSHRNWLASSKDADNAHLGPWPPSSALHVARRKGHGSLLSVMAEKCEACRTRQKYKDSLFC